MLKRDNPSAFRYDPRGLLTLICAKAAQKNNTTGLINMFMTS